jgi:outer membrane biosynthesis protein TonB
MPKRYLVTPKDGRVKKVLPDGRRVLVAIPGQLIDYELAVELGLVKSEPEPTPEPQQEEPPKPAPQERAAKKASPAKKSAPAKPAEPSEPEPAPKFSSYPTKKSSGK